MDLIADGLFIATALTAALYCHVLGRRLRRLSDAESGIGAQILALNKALDETRAGLAETRRGVAEARASVRNAREALAVEVEAARRETQLLSAARAKALDALADTADGAAAPAARPRAAPRTAPRSAAAGTGADAMTDAPGSPRTPPTSLAPLPAGPSAVDAEAGPDAAALGPEDTIPNWPDGVVDLPDEVEADAIFAAAAEQTGTAPGPHDRAANPVGDRRDDPAQAPARDDAAQQGAARAADAGHGTADSGDTGATGAGAPLRVQRLAL